MGMVGQNKVDPSDWLYWLYWSVWQILTVPTAGFHVDGSLMNQRRPRPWRDHAAPAARTTTLRVLNGQLRYLPSGYKTAFAK